MGKRKAEPASLAAEDGSGKRLAAAPEAGSSAAPSSAAPLHVNPKRVRVLKGGRTGNGPVVLWMSRDQRMRDNWALLYAIEQAQANGCGQVAVAFNLVPAFLGAGARHFGFMLRGLRELQPKLKAKGIEFFLLQGDPVQTLPALVGQLGAGLLVTDYSPLRLGRQWRAAVGAALPVEGCPLHEVDAHNVVPVWEASEKREVGARTIRPKIHAKLPEFLKEFPQVPDVKPWQGPAPDAVDWDKLITEVLARGSAVPEVDWCPPGEDAAWEALLGAKRGFLTPKRLGLYADKRNDPSTPSALSNLSPYLHYGHIAPQRAALEAAKHRAKHKAAVESFLEELVVRRELADNFCHHCPANYDSLDCAADWAKDTLNVHRADKREVIYTREQLECSATHDELWNACQSEMVQLGKMHGFMRMYWAKKILEWTNGPEEAIEIAIYLNDKYELDGRDPNGYVGVMWSMAGIHDMGWPERPIFGKIRYMNYNGCKRKFDIKAYVAYVDAAVAKVRAQGKAVALPLTAPPAAAAPGGAGPSGVSAAAAGRKAGKGGSQKTLPELLAAKAKGAAKKAN